MGVVTWLFATGAGKALLAGGAALALLGAAVWWHHDTVETARTEGRAAAEALCHARMAEEALRRQTAVNQLRKEMERVEVIRPGDRDALLERMCRLAGDCNAIDRDGE